jgi:hypothetical protein
MSDGRERFISLAVEASEQRFALRVKACPAQVNQLSLGQ